VRRIVFFAEAGSNMKINKSNLLSAVAMIATAVADA
jgi:hypothetical protein